MNAEIYFIYDSHCPWSYATTQLVNSIRASYPDMPIHLLHIAFYDGTDGFTYKQAKQIADQSSVDFGDDYLSFVQDRKDSTLTANLVTWVQNREPRYALDLLNAIQKEHFQNGNPFVEKSDFNDIVEQFKLSPPAKVFKNNLTKDVEMNMQGIAELQEVTYTDAFPALLLAKDETLVMLNHNLYLTEPNAISEAIALELK